MSGAFEDLNKIIKKRVTNQSIGFGSEISDSKERFDILEQVKSEDLIEFGFESEFIGRLPIRAVFETLTENDLFEILKNPNNPIILGKKFDFGAYDIDIKFEDAALQRLAKEASKENTGARGLVSAIEKDLLIFENKLPSTSIKKFPVTNQIISEQDKSLESFLAREDNPGHDEAFEKVSLDERNFIRKYLISSRKNLEKKFNLTLSPGRVDIVASYYCKHITDVENAMKKVKHYYDEAKRIELSFLNKEDINIVFDDDAIDFVINQCISSPGNNIDQVFEKISIEFVHGLNLVREKTGKNRFFLTKKALLEPNEFISSLIKNELGAQKKLTEE
jgi:hypothetical protein